MADYIEWHTTQTIETGTADEAIRLMNHLREQAIRIDKILGNPNHQWNRIPA